MEARNQSIPVLIDSLRGRGNHLRMCNLYNLKVSRNDLVAAFDAESDASDRIAIDKDYAAPGKPGYVIRSVDGGRMLSAMIWGFPTREPRKRAPKQGQSPYIYSWWTNARHLDKSMWRKWVLQPAQRCLVPFTSFAEPKAQADRADPGDRSWWFSVTNQALPCFAGLWKEDEFGEFGPVYSFLTTEPNPLVAPKHAKAMPVILLAEDHDRWLHGSAEDARALQSGYPSQLMSAQ